MAITITIFSKTTGVWQAFSHSFLSEHCHLWLCCCSSMCAAILSSFCLHPFTFSVFSHLFKLFRPSYSKAFPPFKVSIFLPFQLLQTFNFMFSNQYVQLFKLFQPSSTFLSLHLLKIFIFLPFQLLQTFRFLFSYENVQVFELFQLSSAFLPFHQLKMFLFLPVHLLHTLSFMFS